MKTKQLITELRVLLENSKPIRNFDQIDSLINSIELSLEPVKLEEKVVEVKTETETIEPIEPTELPKPTQSKRTNSIRTNSKR